MRTVDTSAFSSYGNRIFSKADSTYDLFSHCFFRYHRYISGYKGKNISLYRYMICHCFLDSDSYHREEKIDTIKK